jgi:hypothetical protein
LAIIPHGAYRQIKAGRGNFVNETGIILIPRTEVDRILNRARTVALVDHPQ